MKEIRQELRKNDFEEDKVRQAHKLSGHEAMADIISLIKNADSQQNPLLTAEERVNRTLTEIMAAHSFNEEQKEWLAYIKEHLIVNLAIEKENFDVMPVLERHGGLARAKKIFGPDLDTIIAEINYKLVA
ncbi:MAG: type I restriction enzyme EcoKI subunit R [Planctomycetes bacterium ADurb.Bin412]|nr:MAG: type I restriction enzyme EcoKI subunit R [Planctomycetes bacterium ADurb.Bin412]